MLLNTQECKPLNSFYVAEKPLDGPRPYLCMFPPERESVGPGLEGLNLYPCVPVGALGKEPSALTELGAPLLTVVMFALWLPGHILCIFK